jgi:hypothetical protein
MAYLPTEENLKLLVILLSEKSFQVRVIFGPKNTKDEKVTYGFEAPKNKKIANPEDPLSEENILEVPFYETSYSGDVLSFTSEPPTLGSLIKCAQEGAYSAILKMDFEFISYSLFPIDYDCFSKSSKINENLLEQMKARSFSLTLTKKQKDEIQGTVLMTNNFGFKYDNEGWVYEPKSLSVFAVLVNDTPMRLFPGQIRGSINRKKFYHTSVLGRYSDQVLSQTEFDDLVKSVKIYILKEKQDLARRKNQ